MHIPFNKMHGLGNDFVVLFHENSQLRLPAEVIRQWSDRKQGIGFDQLLLLQPTAQSGIDFGYRIFNADGTEVEHCGNGARCVARFALEQGLTTKSELRFATVNSQFLTQILDNGEVRVDMGRPRFEPIDIPIAAKQRQTAYPIELGGETFSMGAVSMGNPHALLWVDDTETAPVKSLGPAIQSSGRFPRGVNVGFARLIGRDRLALRVFERGVGETLACGTGACAAVAIGREQGKLDAAVQVDLSGGQLRLEWPDKNDSIWMTGPAVTVFKGDITL